ncbi:MAG: PepSY domain-containing protein [Sinobacteraceae bacterium]|nr:PepSY domain-containing protein [Nevskiaceae bacterium]
MPRPDRIAALLVCGWLGLGGSLAVAAPWLHGAHSQGARSRPPAGRPLVDDGGGRRVLQQERAISMDEAIDMAQRRFDARVVRAEVVERSGRRIYVLRLLSSDGRVFNVRVDAATGSMQ